MRNRFTLIELLTVIAIIALLAALLIPALSRARFKSKKVVCLSHIRQVYMAASSYTTDNDESLMWGHILDSTHLSNWYFTIQPYLENTKYTLHNDPAPPFLRDACPDARPKQPRITRQSYGMNFRLRYQHLNQPWPRMGTNNENPPEMVVYFMDCWKAEVDRFFGLSMGSEIIRTLTGGPSHINGHPRHQGESLSTIFMDGHAKHVKAKEWWSGHGVHFFERW